jgi:RNA polymerase primary sigma factor
MSMRQLKISKSITIRESQSLEKYLQEIAKQELLSAEEEVVLAVKIREGDQKALDRLIKTNLRFVVSVAKQYQNQGLSLPDLINEGNLGLIKAAQRFDETKGFKFISYAVWWIRQSIAYAIAEQSRIVKVPVNVMGLKNQVGKASLLLEQEFEREPTSEELADHLNLPFDEVTSMLMLHSRHISVDSPLSEEDDGTLIDIMVNENAPKTDGLLVNDESLHMDIHRSLRALSERQKEVVCLFYGIGADHPLSLEDIGQRYSLTRERVRQIKEKAISKLRAAPACKELKGYLG